MSTDPDTQQVEVPTESGSLRTHFDVMRYMRDRCTTAIRNILKNVPPEHAKICAEEMRLLADDCSVAIGDWWRYIHDEAERSKEDALQALTVGMTRRMEQIREEAASRETEASAILVDLNARMEQLVERLRLDSLSQLNNHPHFMEQLEFFIRNELVAKWCTVGVIDLRYFKQVNDTLGHPAGDKVIARIGQILRQNARLHRGDVLAHERQKTDQDIQSRHAGDQFSFFLPNVDPQVGLMIGRRIKDAIETNPWHEEVLGMSKLGADVGIVTMPLGPSADRSPYSLHIANDLWKAADVEVYRAKNRAKTTGLDDVSSSVREYFDGEMKLVQQVS